MLSLAKLTNFFLIFHSFWFICIWHNQYTSEIQSLIFIELFLYEKFFLFNLMFYKDKDSFFEHSSQKYMNKNPSSYFKIYCTCKFFHKLIKSYSRINIQYTKKIIFKWGSNAKFRQSKFTKFMGPLDVPFLNFLKN